MGLDFNHMYHFTQLQYYTPCFDKFLLFKSPCEISIFVMTAFKVYREILKNSTLCTVIVPGGCRLENKGYLAYRCDL